MPESATIDPITRSPFLERALIIAGITAEIAFAALLTRKRFYGHMPFFYGYTCFGIATDLSMFFVQHYFAARYLQIFIVQMCIDSALQYGILVELAWCVLRPVRASLQRGTVAGLSVAILALGSASWPLCSRTNFPPLWHFVASLQQSTSILRILFFVVLAAGSQMLALGWRDRELQVATGLGSYSLVSFAASMVHSHQKLGLSYHWVDLIVAFSYVGSLVYWVVSFAQAEAPRREFTPQMRHVLTAVAAAAHAGRTGGGDLPRVPAIRG